MFKANDFDAKVTFGGIASVFIRRNEKSPGFIT